MAGKVKISADLMDRVMDGTLSGPDAMEAEKIRRANVSLAKKVARMKTDIDAMNRQRVTNGEALDELLTPGTPAEPAPTE